MARDNANLELGFMTLPRTFGQTAEIAIEAEAAGYTWLGIPDSPAVYPESFLHQQVALRATTQLRVGPLVSHVIVRHPLIVGNLFATLNEASDGRTIGTLATGNSAARGLGLRPATIADLEEAVHCIRSYWAGEGGNFRGSSIPATRVCRRGCPLMIAADGPRGAALAGRCADGLLYGGTLKSEVFARRVASGRTRPEQAVWLAPAASLADTVDGVLDDIGAIIVAIANRAFRGDLDERGVPAELQPDIRTMWANYDYSVHGDNARPRNVELISRPLAEYLVRDFVLWGNEQQWKSRLDHIAGHGCDGVLLMLGQNNQRRAIRNITARLQDLGLLRS